MNAPTPKPWIDAIEAYVPGRDTTEDGRKVAKLSSNENPLGPSPKAIAAMRAVAGQAHRYPDGSATALREAIGALHGLERDRVVCGTGSDEILQLLALAYASHGDEILYVRHGFMVYPIAAMRAGATPVAAPDVDYRADVDQLLAQVNGRTRLIYLANPNNPTGTMIGRSDVLRLQQRLPKDVLLVLDAAYAEYIDDPDYEDGLALARTEPNVITTRTFSKIYGLAAERVGWAYGPKPVIDTLHKIRGPFNVTTAGIAGALSALDDQDWVEKSRAHNIKWRGWLAQEIASLDNAGLRAVPSAANFILITFAPEGPHTAEAANRFLAREGYLTRWLPKQGLANGLRISIGTEEEMRGVADALRRFATETDGPSLRARSSEAG